MTNINETSKLKSKLEKILEFDTDNLANSIKRIQITDITDNNRDNNKEIKTRARCIRRALNICKEMRKKKEEEEKSTNEFVMCFKNKLQIVDYQNPNLIMNSRCGTNIFTGCEYIV